jgi:dephospho-CoA kinase
VDERRALDESAVVVIPLLFEAGADRGWTAILCVTAEEELVRERLKGRGLSAEQADQRIAAQMPVEEKASRADYVIENSGTLEELEHRVRTTWTAIVDKE